MSPVADALVVLVFVFGAGYLGLSLRRRLPEQHLHEESLGMVRLCTGVIATLTALVLGLLIASAKSNYDRVNDEVTSAAASVVLLDGTLAQYGAQTREARSLLRTSVATSLETVFAPHGRGLADLDTSEG